MLTRKLFKENRYKSTMKFSIIFSFLVLIALLSLSSSALESISGTELTISNKTFNEDLYIAGTILTFNSIVLGDFIAAGGDVFVSGSIVEDALIVGANVFINARVGGDARIFGGVVEVSSYIDGDLVVFGGKVILTEDAFIRGNIKINGFNVDIKNDHNSRFHVRAATLTLDSIIFGDIKLTANEIYASEDLNIIGNLDYSSERRNEVLEDSVDGDVNFNQIINGDKTGFILAATGFGYVMNKLYWLVLLLILGLLVINIIPKFSFEVASNIKTRTISTFLVGILVMFGIPFATVVLLLSLIGIPFGIFTGALYAFIFLFVRLFSIYFIGIFVMKFISKNNSLVAKMFITTKNSNSRRYKSKEFHDRNLCYFLGIALYGLLSFIPFLSFIVSTFVTLFAAGAFTIAKYESFMFWKKKEQV